jgi:predicted MPP superfamily phosphohydrolase
MLKKIIKILVFLIILFLLAICYSLIEPYWLQIKKIVITDDDIPEAFQDIKIVFITDIHHGTFYSIDRVKKLVDTVNNLKPHMIFLGGDYVYRDKKYIKPVFEELKNLYAPEGKFGVLGNHDHWQSKELTLQSMKDGGIKDLDNSSMWIYRKEEKIKIGGVGDFMTDTQDINSTVKDVREKDFVILLSHSPDYVEEINNYKIDLMLSGHTHGGQVTFFGLWTPFIPSIYGDKYRTGIINTKYTKLIVSNGTGTVIKPVRFCARPQILVIYLRSEK